MTLSDEISALTEGVKNPVSNLANTAALIFERIPRLNWAGFYLTNGEVLELGPFAGKPACTVIPFGKGVCGTAALTGRTQLVPDVHAFPGHIACDGASRSELVVPLFRDGLCLGVLDLDSPELGRFTEKERLLFEEAARIIEQFL